MAGSGQQKWSSETGGWVDDTGDGEVSESLGPASSDEVEESFSPARLPTRGIHSTTMARLPQVALVLLGAGILAIIISTVFVIHKPNLGAAPPFQDLGPGISNVAGLKGHLVTRWEKKVQYKLTFEPLFGIYSPGFSYTVGHPPGALWVNIRLLDATGYALCGKQIQFRLGPARSNVDLTSAQGAGAKVLKVSATAPGGSGGGSAPPWGRGRDTFQDQIGDAGQIISVTAQGELPCSADQYKKFYYWDFSTNFPSTSEQDALMKAPAIAAAKAAAEARAAERRKEERTPHFYVEGDTSVLAYDAASETLQAGTGQSFILEKKNQAPTADAWAATNAQIHYKCDTLANCMLTRAGDGRIVNARSLH
jgi:hypothetical protein